MKSFLSYAMPFLALLLASCHVPTAKRPTVQARPNYRFEERQPVGLSPCAACVDFEAAKRYTGGDITWNICQTNDRRGYLDLRVSKGRAAYRLRVVKYCEEQEVIPLLQCPSEGNASAAYMITTFTEGMQTVSLTLPNGGEPFILQLTIPASNKVGVKLADGWTLDYGRHVCEG